MFNTRQNYHHSKLPGVGEIHRHPFDRRKIIVTAYPLCDNVLPWSVGIHTVYIQYLDNGQTGKLSGFYLTQN